MRCSALAANSAAAFALWNFSVHRPTWSTGLPRNAKMPARPARPASATGANLRARGVRSGPGTARSAICCDQRAGRDVTAIAAIAAGRASRCANGAYRNSLRRSNCRRAEHPFGILSAAACTAGDT
jgi:hypothetical protein